MQYGVWSYTTSYCVVMCDYVSELSVSVNHCLLVVAETAGSSRAQLGGVRATAHRAQPPQ